MRNWRRWLLGLAFTAFLCVNGVGLYIGAVIYNEMSVLHSRKNAYNTERWQRILENGIKNRQWKNVTLESRFGYSLQGTFIPHPVATDKTLIFLHGFTENRLVGLQYRSMYLNAGFNLLLIDSRAHGESGGDSVTWGVYEQCDLDQWVGWVRQRFPKGMIGVHGMSMGAATALLHAEQNETDRQVTFYIADSSFSDFLAMVSPHAQKRMETLKNIPLSYIWPYVNVMAYAKSRFTFYQASPIRSVKYVRTPILFIHGEADKLVPVGMSQELYQAARGPRELFTLPEAGHVGAFYQDRIRYAKVVNSFIKSLESIVVETGESGNGPAQL